MKMHVLCKNYTRANFLFFLIVMCDFLNYNYYISRAFNYSYPNNLTYKRFDRKARCQRALKVCFSHFKLKPVLKQVGWSCSENRKYNR